MAYEFHVHIKPYNAILAIMTPSLTVGQLMLTCAIAQRKCGDLPQRIIKETIEEPKAWPNYHVTVRSY